MDEEKTSQPEQKKRKNIKQDCPSENLPPTIICINLLESMHKALLSNAVSSGAKACVSDLFLCMWQEIAEVSLESLPETLLR